MCDYTTVLPQRSVKQVFEDCIARHRIIKQKQEQVGKKFANLLENVKKQQLEEKRMALLDLLKTEKTAMASGTITPDLAAAPMDASNYGNYIYIYIYSHIRIYIYIYIYRRTWWGECNRFEKGSGGTKG